MGDDDGDKSAVPASTLLQTENWIQDRYAEMKTNAINVIAESQTGMKADEYRVLTGLMLTSFMLILK